MHRLLTALAVSAALIRPAIAADYWDVTATRIDPAGHPMVQATFALIGLSCTPLAVYRIGQSMKAGKEVYAVTCQQGTTYLLEIMPGFGAVVSDCAKERDLCLAAMGK